MLEFFDVRARPPVSRSHERRPSAGGSGHALPGAARARGAARGRPGARERRRRGPKSERTRQRILDAAARTFRDKGYAGTTLNDIAVAALLRAGSIYYHFDSKERLLEEVLDIGIARVSAAVQRAIEALPPDVSPTERIRTGIEAHLRSLLYHGEYTSASFRIFGRLRATSSRGSCPGAAPTPTTGGNMLREARAAGEIPAERDLGLARMFLFGALNWSVEWYDPEKGALDDFVREAAETCLHGILAPPGAGGGRRALC